MARNTRDVNIDSAVALARAIVASDATDEHKREFLSYCIWKASEAGGKYNLRYWSEGVLELVKKHGSVDAVTKLRPLPLRHEHVNTRKTLVDAMMRDPASVDRVLREDAIACIVTDAEHNRLSKAHSGFDRYVAVGIRVWDTTDEIWLARNQE